MPPEVFLEKVLKEKGAAEYAAPSQLPEGNYFIVSSASIIA
jgi:hypothetical protein